MTTDAHVPPVLHLVLPGEPQPKERPRFGRGRIYTPAATRRAELGIAWEATRVLRRTFNDGEGLYRLELLFRCAAKSGPDIDNLVKLVMDALSPRRARARPAAPGLLWRNDRQIVSLAATRTDRSRYPATEITVWRHSPG